MMRWLLRSTAVSLRTVNRLNVSSASQTSTQAVALCYEIVYICSAGNLAILYFHCVNCTSSYRRFCSQSVKFYCSKMYFLI